MQFIKLLYVCTAETDLDARMLGGLGLIYWHILSLFFMVIFNLSFPSLLFTCVSNLLYDVTFRSSQMAAILEVKALQGNQYLFNDKETSSIGWHYG